jgi:hypothetical protein
MAISFLADNEDHPLMPDIAWIGWLGRWTFEQRKSAHSVVNVDQTDIELLKSRIDKNVQLHCRDGEIVVGTVHFVSEEKRDVIYDLISSNRNSRYQAFGDSAYRLTFDEIEFVTLPES